MADEIKLTKSDSYQPSAPVSGSAAIPHKTRKKFNRFNYHKFKSEHMKRCIYGFKELHKECLSCNILQECRG